MKHRKIKTFAIIAVECAILWGVCETVGYFVIRRKEANQPTGMYAENIMNFTEPLLDFALKKNVSQNMGGNWTVKTNFLGFRDSEELLREKPKDEYRLFVVGGSTVFGWGVNAEDSMPSHLQKLIPKANGKRVRVINAGVPWYASWNESAMIFHRILRLHPDHIVVFNGLNDVSKSLAPNWSPIYEGYADIPTRLAFQKRSEHASTGSVIFDLFRISPTLNYFITKRKMKSQIETGVIHPEVWDQYEAYMVSLKEISEKRGIGFSLFYQPVIVAGKTLTEEEMNRNASMIRHEGFAQTFREAYLMGEKKLTANPFLKVTSLKNLFEKRSELIYLDGLHYNALGNQLVAEAISQKLNLH